MIWSRDVRQLQSVTAAALKNSVLTAASVVRIKKQVVLEKVQHNGHPSLDQNFNANVPTLQKSCRSGHKCGCDKGRLLWWIFRHRLLYFRKLYGVVACHSLFFASTATNTPLVTGQLSVYQVIPGFEIVMVSKPLTLSVSLVPFALQKVQESLRVVCSIK